MIDRRVAAMDIASELAAAHRVLADHAWTEALDRFGAAEAASALSVDDLVAMADAAF